VETRLSAADIAGRWLMRWGIGRKRYRVAPGLYAVGSPNAGSPVLVSANYKMSFDSLRSELDDLDAWILVIDTKGINVWCAAGKGTFGTDEIVSRIEKTSLDRLVSHRSLVVPQLGAVGVAAHEVMKRSGFKVVYGPVRASDLKTFLSSGMVATKEMRQVTFSFVERLVLTPVELVGMFKPLFWISLVLLLLGGIGRDIFSFQAALTRGGGAIVTVFAGVVAGAVLTPILLPWIPARAFSLKGGIVGVATTAFLLPLLPSLEFVEATPLLLALSGLASYTAMNFTGSTPFTSPSGVEKEMRRAIPLQGGALLTALILWIVSGF